MTLDDYIRAPGLPPGGAVRASLGLASNFADIDRFLTFAREFTISRTSPTTCRLAPLADQRSHAIRPLLLTVGVEALTGGGVCL
jgi:hypothetical protein